MMFFEKKCYCILCRLYKDAGKMKTINGEIGICKACYEKLKTTKDMSFDGGEGVKAVFSPYEYKGKLADCVKAYKFSGQSLFGGLFGKLIYEELKAISHLWEYDAVIPVPLHEKRLQERGYNQSEIIARKMSEISGVSIIDDGVFRIRETKRQSSLGARERRENVKGAFYAYPKAVAGKRVLLVDDICTMGETIRACADALIKAGTREITAITLCVSAKEEKEFSLY